jgi:uncharacterized protein YdhG (YjbR/CyaY superfamily)
MNRMQGGMGRSAPKKPVSKPRDTDEYLAGIPEPARSTLSKVRTAIRAALPPDATETISYGMPAFRHNGRVVLWFAAFSNHCSFFPTAAVIAAFPRELKKYSVSKGTVQFPIDKPLPDVLIRKLVKARVARSEIGRA